jgi:CRISPR/Cas system-associated exonuclease Cas4 (RecB family)|tara:strand:- start:3263 stop:3574 length:312 start_codon:yes stop_codon:yes gene_type:complete
MGQQLKEVEEYISEAIRNISNDRSITSTLLSDLIVEMKKSSQPDEVHKQLGQIAAKYVETLQRSNEQLVKITTLMYKKTASSEDLSLSSKDKDELFDLIQGAG